MSSPPDISRFIREAAAPAAPPLVPECTLYLARELVPLWQALEQTLGVRNAPPPFWAFAWAGGQAVARFVLDNPDLVRGRAVLDFGAGSGLVAIAAARAGARRVLAADIDPCAAEATRLNAALNSVAVDVLADDVVGQDLADIDVVLAGDICYERAFSLRVIDWLRGLAARGVTILVGDPGRTYFPESRMVPLARYDVPASLEIESRALVPTGVWRLVP